MTSQSFTRPSPWAPLSLLALVWLAGCTSSSLTTQSYDPKQKDRLLYYLPKSEYEIAAKFDVYVWQEDAPPADDQKKNPAPPLFAGLKGGTTDALLVLSGDDQALSVTAHTVADPTLDFSLEVKSTPAVAISGLEISLSDQGLLTAVNADFDDKTATVVSNTLDTVLSLAKAIKAAEERSKPSGHWIKAAISYTRHKTVGAKELMDAGGAGLSDFFGPQLKDIADHQDFRLVSAYGTYVIKNVKSPQTDGYPDLRVSLTAAKTEAAAASSKELLSNFPVANGQSAGALPGILYRAANPGVLSIHSGTATTADYAVNVFDTAPIRFLEYRSRTFSKRTIKATFGDHGLTKYTLDATSVAETASASLKSGTSAILTEQASAKAARDKARLDEFTREKNLVSLQADLTSTEAQISQAQAAYTAASDADKPAKNLELLRLIKQRDLLQVSLRAAQAGLSLP